MDGGSEEHGNRGMTARGEVCTRCVDGCRCVRGARQLTRHLRLVSASHARSPTSQKARARQQAYKIKYEVCDGALPEFLDRRNELFKISGKRGLRRG